MTARSLRLSVCCALTLGALALTGGAIAQTYGSATNDQGADTRDANGNVKTSFSVNETIVLQCSAPSGVRCGDPGASATGLFSQSPPVVLGRTTVDSNGRYRIVSTIPSSARNGSATVSVSTTLNGSNVTYTRAITVTGAALSTLPVTGRDIVLMVIWGLVFIGAGSVLITFTWRQWRHATHHARALAVRPNLGALDTSGVQHIRPAATRAIGPRTPKVLPAAPRPARDSSLDGHIQKTIDKLADANERTQEKLRTGLADLIEEPARR